MFSLNCDLGEGHDDADQNIMPFIHQASIACGGHAGNSHSMRRAVRLAKANNVEIGAHPSYPDKKNFGRIRIEIPPETLFSSLYQQVLSLKSICREEGVAMSYIKPHGALYNDLNTNSALRKLVEKLALEFECKIMRQALLNDNLQTNSQGIESYLEGFADRAYTDDGFLVNRSNSRAVYQELEPIAAQASSFFNQGGVKSINGHWLNLKIETLCVHGDSPQAIAAVKHIHELLH